MNAIYDLGNLEQYDGTELSLVVEALDHEGKSYCEALSTIEMSEVDLTRYNSPKLFYSVYTHLKTGGVDCAGDFDTLEDAQIYCHALDTLLGVI